VFGFHVSMNNASEVRRVKSICNLCPHHAHSSPMETALVLKQIMHACASYQPHHKIRLTIRRSSVIKSGSHVRMLESRADESLSRKTLLNFPVPNKRLANNLDGNFFSQSKVFRPKDSPDAPFAQLGHDAITPINNAPNPIEHVTIRCAIRLA